jgi:uncharacterized membrane protein YfcA
MEMALLTLGGSFVIGVVGAILGVGGGVFLVPFLVLVVGLRPVEAVGVSLFAVVGMSVGGASRALRTGQANLGLALWLEPLLLVTAVGGSLLAHRMADRTLLGLFGAMMLVISLLFAGDAKRGVDTQPVAPERPARLTDGVSAEPGREPEAYRPARLPLVTLLIGATGIAAGLFGIGGGVLNVPVLTLLGRVPLRAAACTSVLTMSVTAAAAAAVHLAEGNVPAALVGASLLGVVPGGMLGARLQARLLERNLQAAFAVLAALVAGATLLRVRGLV